MPVFGKKEYIMIAGDSVMNSSEADRQGNGAEPETPRHPYVKPSFSWECVFETRALACGKTSGNFCLYHGGLNS